MKAKSQYNVLLLITLFPLSTGNYLSWLSQPYRQRLLPLKFMPLNLFTNKMFSFIEFYVKEKTHIYLIPIRPDQWTGGLHTTNNMSRLRWKFWTC